MIMTLLVMAVGGTGFIIALNVYASMYNTVNVRMESTNFNIRLSLDEPASYDELYDIVMNVDGVVKAETWNGTLGQIGYDDGTYGNALVLWHQKQILL